MIICLRVVTAVIFIYVLLTFAVYSILIGPVQDSRSTGLKFSRYSGTTEEEITSRFRVNSRQWGISVVSLI